MWTIQKWFIVKKKWVWWQWIIDRGSQTQKKSTWKTQQQPLVGHRSQVTSSRRTVSVKQMLGSDIFWRLSEGFEKCTQYTQTLVQHSQQNDFLSSLRYFCNVFASQTAGLKKKKRKNQKRKTLWKINTDLTKKFYFTPTYMFRID